MKERKTILKSVTLSKSAIEDLTQLKLLAEDLIKQFKEKVEQNGKTLHSSLCGISLFDEANDKLLLSVLIEAGWRCYQTRSSLNCIVIFLQSTV